MIIGMITIRADGSDTARAELRRLIRQNGLEREAEICAACAECDILLALGGADACCRARVLVAASEGGARALRRADAETVVTVGLDPRDTVTPSSLLHEGGMAALQRELVSLSGEIVGPRELDLTHLKGGITEKMAVAAAMLVLSANAEW